MKRQSLKAKQYYLFWLYEKFRIGFSKIDDSVKYALQKWIISHSHVIQSTISNYYIKLKLDYENWGEKTELRQKVHLWLYVHDIHIGMQKKDDTGFSIAYYDKGILHISGSSLQLIIPPQLRNMTQCHQIMCGWKICIQAGSYQEPLNPWRKRRLWFINNRTKSFMSGSDEQFNA